MGAVKTAWNIATFPFKVVMWPFQVAKNATVYTLLGVALGSCVAAGSDCGNSARKVIVEGMDHYNTYECLEKHGRDACEIRYRGLKGILENPLYEDIKVKLDDGYLARTKRVFGALGEVYQDSVNLYKRFAGDDDLGGLIESGRKEISEGVGRAEELVRDMTKIEKIRRKYKDK